ncbi:MAG: 4-alpha-glucanotransferase [Chroococcales cyanobacterium]
MFDVRVSGILLHPTSFPSRFGIGDLGPFAYRFVDFLAESGQQVWQVLPLGPTGYGNSPYLSYSALAGNPLLISLEWLQGDGFLSEEDVGHPPDFPEDRVDYEKVIATKLPLLRNAFENFKEKASQQQKQEYQEFCDRHSYWVNDYGLFMALKEAHNGASWNEWEPAIAKREPNAIQEWKERLGGEIFYHKWLQYEFFRQWQTLKGYANERGIQILGDIPIYVAHDSMAVWAHPEIFCLDEETGKPALMAGVPPDYFSDTGQLWGNPVYKWEHLEKTNFEWWVQRFHGTLDYVDIVRIDHFRAFEAYWAVPGNETVATHGEWIQAPGEKFFKILDQRLGKLPIIAEDLGVITPEVEALRDQFEFPGMKVLHFAFDSGPGSSFLPFNYSNRNCVVYTGTHDNDTTAGWWSHRPIEAQERVLEYLGCLDPLGIHWSLIRLAMSSVANIAIMPLQDVMGLGSEARMNTPSQAEGNWEWRYTPEALTESLRDHLKHLTYLYGRVPH